MAWKPVLIYKYCSQVSSSSPASRAIIILNIITQVIIEVLVLSLAENGVIFCYNHLRRGDYSGRTIFQNGRLAPRLVLSICRKRKITSWNKMLFREKPNTPESSERHSSKIKGENCAKCSKETIKIPVKSSLKFSQHFVCLTEWFQEN